MYSGSFEREMCAYITGHIGECGVGYSFVDKKYTKLFKPYILQIDEQNSGCKRPVKIYPNPKYSNNSDSKLIKSFIVPLLSTSNIGNIRECLPGIGVFSWR